MSLPKSSSFLYQWFWAEADVILQTCQNLHYSWLINVWYIRYPRSRAPELHSLDSYPELFVRSRFQHFSLRKNLHEVCSINLEKLNESWGEKTKLWPWIKRRLNRCLLSHFLWRWFYRAHLLGEIGHNLVSRFKYRSFLAPQIWYSIFSWNKLL